MSNQSTSNKPTDLPWTDPSQKQKNNFQMTKKHVNKINSGMGAIEGPISPQSWWFEMRWVNLRKKGLLDYKSIFHEPQQVAVVKVHKETQGHGTEENNMT